LYLPNLFFFSSVPGASWRPELLTPSPGGGGASTPWYAAPNGLYALGAGAAGAEVSTGCAVLST
jgi:hypothetical protein